MASTSTTTSKSGAAARVLDGDPLHALHTSPEVAARMECFIFGEKFFFDPVSGRAFLDELTRIAAASLPGPEAYSALATLYRRLPESSVVDSKYHQRRLEQRVAQVKAVLGDRQPSSFVDVGCGDGNLTRAMAAAWGLPREAAFGVELFIRPDAKFDEITLVPFDGKTLPFPDNSQELLTLFMVLHHAPDPQALIQEISRVLKPGGRVLVRDHDTTSPGAAKFFELTDRLFYSVFHQYPDIPIPGNYLSLEAWTNEFSRAGLAKEKEFALEPESAFSPFFAVFSR
jgi:ubiquinone/menaquinone biosynthesis C-methylase UbiE